MGCSMASAMGVNELIYETNMLVEKLEAVRVHGLQYGICGESWY